MLIIFLDFIVLLQIEDILFKEDVKIEVVFLNGCVIKMFGVGIYNVQFEFDEIGIIFFVELL